MCTVLSISSSLSDSKFTFSYYYMSHIARIKYCFKCNINVLYISTFSQIALFMAHLKYRIL